MKKNTNKISKLLNKKHVKALITVLNKSNILFRFVGGCVRDSILKKDINDIDIAIECDSNIALNKIKEFGINAFSLSHGHGTIIVEIFGIYFQLTTLRIDKETNGRHAKTEKTNDWSLDAKRRDFTINAIYADEKGVIYAPIENSLEDLEKGKIRFIGDANERIKEDYLRILRFLRFSACFGKEKPLIAEINACYENMNKISTISRERITYELIKMCKGNYLGKILTHFLKVDEKKLQDMFAIIFKTNRFIININAYSNIMKIINRTKIEIDPLMVIIVTFNLGYNEIKKCFILKREEDRYLKKIFKAIEIYKDIKNNSKNINIPKYLIYLYDLKICLNTLIYFFSQDDLEEESKIKIINKILQISIPILPVCAKDLIVAMKYPQGLKLGETLRNLEQIWIESNFEMKKKELLEKTTSNI